MRTETVTVRTGENVGPVDWSHETAANMPPIWREAESDPDSHLFNGRPVLAVCMYDGWPYWEPRPAVLYVGPLGGGEWAFFNSYGAHPGSIERRTTPARSEERRAGE